MIKFCLCLLLLGGLLVFCFSQDIPNNPAALLQQYHAAEQLYGQAEKLSLETGDTTTQSRTGQLYHQALIAYTALEASVRQAGYDSLLPLIYARTGYINYYFDSLETINKHYQAQGLLFKYKGDQLAREGQYFDALRQYQQAIIQMDTNFTETDIYQNPTTFSTPVSFNNLFTTLIAKAQVFEKLEHGQKNVKALSAALEAYRSAFLLAGFVQKTYDSDDARLFLTKTRQAIHNRPVLVSLELYDITHQQKFLEDVYFFDQSSKGFSLSLNIQGKGTVKQLPSIASIQQLIDNKTAIISYHLYDSSLLASVITRNEFTYYLQILPTDFYATIDSFRHALQNHQSQQYDPNAAKKLYSLLIQPIHPMLEKSNRLLIIPDGELNYLPFEALEDEHDKYLLEEFAVQYQYSTAWLGQSGIRSKRGSILAFAPLINTAYNDSTYSLISLSRAFAYTGYPIIIASLWEAEGKTTAFIKTRLYEYLAEGYSKDRALQKARLDLLQTDEIEPRFKTPGYWTQLVLIGEYEPPYKPTPWLLIAVVAATVVALLLILTLKRNYW
jgi:hypothetical protein